jgi:DNA-binding NarL/FixJ family response regulator
MQMMSAEIDVLIADDHPIFRKGLREVIEAEAGFRCVGEAADGEAALDAIARLQPQVVVLDIQMPNADGFAVVHAIRERRLPVRVVFLTMYDDEDVLNHALDLGVDGYVLKESAANDIVGAIRTVANGGSYISPSSAGYLLARRGRAADLATRTPGVQDLTPAERRILKLIAQHKTSKDIAGELFVSHRTVENHRQNICQKLGIHGSNGLLKFAIEHKSQLASTAD